MEFLKEEYDSHDDRAVAPPPAVTLPNVETAADPSVTVETAAESSVTVETAAAESSAAPEPPTGPKWKRYKWRDASGKLHHFPFSTIGAPWRGMASFF